MDGRKTEDSYVRELEKSLSMVNSVEYLSQIGFRLYNFLHVTKDLCLGYLI